MTRKQEQKHLLRQEIRSAAKSLDKSYLQKSNDDIQAALLSLPEWERAQTVFIYISMGREPQTKEIITAALNSGKRVAVPRCMADGIMDCRAISSFEGLTPKSFGILEPDCSFPEVLPHEMDLVVAPCVAVDRNRYRLGNGGGYYDRFLSDVDCPIICLCHDALIQDRLPIEDFDVPVHMILSSEGVLGSYP